MNDDELGVPNISNNLTQAEQELELNLDVEGKTNQRTTDDVENYNRQDSDESDFSEGNSGNEHDIYEDFLHEDDAKQFFQDSKDFQVSVFQDNKLSGLDEGGENDVVV